MVGDNIGIKISLVSVIGGALHVGAGQDVGADRVA